MNIDQIKTECFILALFIREDGERILLGSGEYEFKGSQLHFAADSYANDVVEVQGNDGVFLAGQVRRPSSQVFDGYIGDATVRKPKIEEYRRHFLAFFRKNYYYTVVYIFPDGTAIQRRKGFIVDAPEVKELYQVYPEYHIALNFEDVNYYSYSEDESGQETYTKSALINLSTGGVKGGLVWDAVGAVNLPYTWTDPVEFTGSDLVINNALDVMVPLEGMELRGDTFQQTYSGKNLFPLGTGSYTNHGFTSVYNADGSITVSGTAEITYANLTAARTVNYEQGKTFTLSIDKTLSCNVGAILFGTGTTREDINILAGNKSGSKTLAQTHTTATLYIYGLTVGQSYSFTIYPMLEEGSTATTYEPYVGGTASPNPDYPQNINTVTGEQTVSVVGENLFDRRNASENTILTWVYGANNTENGTLVGPYINVNEGDKFISNYTMIVFFYDSSSNYLGVLQDDEGTIAKRAPLNAFNPKSFTVPNGLSIAKMRIEYRKNKGDNPEDMVAVNDIMLNPGTTLLPYSPSQSQVHEVNLGKNLWGGFNSDYAQTDHSVSFVSYKDGSISAEGTSDGSAYSMYAAAARSEGRLRKLSAGTYTLSGGTSTIRIMFVVVGPGTTFVTDANTGKVSFTLTGDVEGYICAQVTSGTTADGIVYPQLEAGNTATSYAPYIEPIELCKIGNYQDYIYKSGDDWYVHKEVGKNTVDTSTITAYTGYTNIDYALINKPTDYIEYDTFQYDPLYFTHALCFLSPEGGSSGYDTADNIGKAYFGGARVKFRVGFAKGTTLSVMQSTFAGAMLYYPLATPTDTQITDEALLSKLNAIGATRLFVGQNNISVQSAGSNLPVLLKASYATGLDTAGAGFEWEEGGSGGPTTVMVDSIDRVYPVWRLTGPAVNPQLAVLETGTTISYTGTITASQTLEIDMFNKTAKLNGTSVIGNVSGDWVYFRPGNNRVAYTTNNADALPSMIYWQEVVG